MDKLKQQLAPVLKYGFWIGVCVSAIASLAVWYMATGTLQSEAETQRQKITSASTSVTNLQSELPSHPNAKSHQEMQAMIDARQDEVLDAWKSMYDRQRKLLTWPMELQESFVKEFEGLIPIEEFVGFPAEEGQEKEAFLLERYRYYIGLILPEIAEIARAKWIAPFDPTFNPSLEGIGVQIKPRISISGKDDKPLVEWNGGSQEQLLKDLFPWRGTRPSTLQVYYSQENIWILKQILQVIDTVNADAKEAFDAKIREIKTINIGSSVRFNPGTISSVQLQTAGGMESGFSGAMDSGSAGGMDSSGGTDGYGGGTASDPGDGRYVDTQLAPITGASLRSALKSQSPTDVNLAVAKRVPVMMSVRMDQRYIPKLLAACGSAPLMIEVRQVRILPMGTSTAGSSGGSESSAMMSGFGSDSGGGFGGGGFESSDGGVSAASGSLESQAADPYEVDIEVYGLIYIYNPPAKDKLGVEKVDESTVVEGLIGEKPTTSADALPTPVPVEAVADPDAPRTEPAPAAPADAAPPVGAPAAPAPATAEPQVPVAPAGVVPADPVAAPPPG